MICSKRVERAIQAYADEVYGGDVFDLAGATTTGGEK